MVAFGNRMGMLTIEFEVHWSATPVMGLLLQILMARSLFVAVTDERIPLAAPNTPKHTIKPLLCLLRVALCLIQESPRGTVGRSVGRQWY